MRVCELFESIQGEGLNVGAPSFFIRTGRCSVGCRFCDTKYSWDSGRDYALKELVKEVESSGLPEVVITGGEPFEEEELPLLVEELTALSSVRLITVETCGYIYRELPQKKLHLVLSPKPPTMEVAFPADSLVMFLKTFKSVELKFPVFSVEDFETAEEFLFKNSRLIPQPVVFQPLHHPEEDYVETCRRVWRILRGRGALIKSFRVRLIPQVHKLLGLK